MADAFVRHRPEKQLVPAEEAQILLRLRTVLPFSITGGAREKQFPEILEQGRLALLGRAIQRNFEGSCIHHLIAEPAAGL